MDTIIGNCDSSLFWEVKEETTLKSWNSLLGKETIDLYNTSVTKGNQESHGQNFQKLGKDLMSVDELAVMDGGKCLLQIRGVRPFLSRKYDITKHPITNCFPILMRRTLLISKSFFLPGCRCVPVNDTAIMKSQPKIWLPRLYRVVPACQSMMPWQALFLSR